MSTTNWNIAVAAENAINQPSEKWSAWIEAAGYLGNGADRGEVAAFLPLAQTNDRLLFADWRGKLFTHDMQEGNFAFGYREIYHDWIFGAWTGYDIRGSASDHIFHQISGGLEALSEDFDFRLNGYLPLTDPIAVQSNAQVTVSENQIYLTDAREVPLGGADAEVGYRIPIENLFDQTSHHEMRVHLGGFFFTGSNIQRDLYGPRVRTEWRMFDLPQMPIGSRFTVEVEYQHDAVRNSQIEAGFRLRIPLALPGSSSSPARLPLLSALERRMTESLERDTDIVVGRSGRESLIDVATGTAFERVITVDSNGNLETATANAGANSLIIVDGHLGHVVGEISLSANQTLAGGGSNLALRGATSGVAVSLVLPGTAPTIDPNCGCLNIVEVAGSNVHISGLSIDGQNISGNGIGISIDLDNVSVNQVSIANTGASGIEVLSNTVASLSNVAISNSGAPGILGDTGNRLTLSDVTIRSASFGGMAFNNNNNVTISSTQVIGASGEGISFNDNNVISISGGLVQNVNSDGLSFGNNNNVTVSGLRVTQAVGNAIQTGDSNVFSLLDARIDTIGNDALHFGSNNQLTVSRTVFSGGIANDLLNFSGLGNHVLNSTDNVNSTIYLGNRLCASGPGTGFDGILSFSNSTTLQDNVAPCN